MPAGPGRLLPALASGTSGSTPWLSTHADLFRLAITQAGWNGKVELAAGAKVQQSENLAHMQMTRGKVWGLGRDVGPQANGGDSGTILPKDETGR